MVGARRMTDPNVLGGDKYGLKFLFDSGNTEIVHLARMAGMGAGSDAHEFPNELLSLQKADSGLEGSAWSVPAAHVFYMMACTVFSPVTSDLSFSIQRNSTINNQALGDNLWQSYIDNTATHNPQTFVVGGLQFNAGDYVTPYELTGSGQRWGFNCWGVLCDA